MRPPVDSGLSALLRIVTRRAEKPAPRPLSVWSGLSFMGMVGWGFAVPVLLGIALGRWMDQHLPGHHVWMLTLLCVGVLVGGINVWRWIVRTGLVEDGQVEDEQTKDKQTDKQTDKQGKDKP
jgi:ATP synthase protein I